jgi:hypothetical protein
VFAGSNQVILTEVTEVAADGKGNDASENRCRTGTNEGSMTPAALVKEVEGLVGGVLLNTTVSSEYEGAGGDFGGNVRAGSNALNGSKKLTDGNGEIHPWNQMPVGGLLGDGQSDHVDNSFEPPSLSLSQSNSSMPNEEPRGNFTSCCPEDIKEISADVRTSASASGRRKVSSKGRLTKQAEVEADEPPEVPQVLDLDPAAGESDEATRDQGGEGAHAEVAKSCIDGAQCKDHRSENKRSTRASTVVSAGLDY